MMKPCYKVGAYLVAIFTSAFSFGDCDGLRKYQTSAKNITTICKPNIDVAFGYDTELRSPSWAVYNMNIKTASLKPFYLKYAGAIASIREVSSTSQSSVEMIVASGQAKAFLVPHYNVLNYGRDLNEYLTMANVFPVEKNAWQNISSKYMFELGIQERDMAIIKGNFVVITGVAYGAEHVNDIPTAKYLYKVYFHEQYNYTLSYLLPVNAKSQHLDKYITSIKCIEQVTGHNLLDGLAETVKKTVINGVAYSHEYWVAPNQLERECLVVE